MSGNASGNMIGNTGGNMCGGMLLYQLLARSHHSVMTGGRQRRAAAA